MTVPAAENAPNYTHDGYTWNGFEGKPSSKEANIRACSVCGAAVLNTTVHTAWHAEQDQTKGLAGMLNPIKGAWDVT